MRRLGISVYPGNATLDRYREYLELASSCGFSRVFTCLISTDDSHILQFKEITKVATKLGMEVIADVNRDALKKMGIHYKNLEQLHELNLTGIRLDEGFGGVEESLMSFNKENLKIEINMSNGTKQIENILAFQPNKENIIGCHNFYPHKYTGLSRKYFINCSKVFKENGVRTAAFVTSQNGEFGPWPVNEGLCTLEEHRFLPIEVQAKDLFNTEFIDDVIIGNCFATEEELKKLSNLNRNLVSLKVNLYENISYIQRKILLDEEHFNRGDVSEYMIRSTQSRVKYRNEYFEPLNIREIKKGDILIESSLYKRYSGELQIALKDMENSGKTSVVGRIAEEEIYLLDYIRPWQKFKFEES
ncbi:DUF871 domain-containing protein [Clostridium senegalense]|uniref:DUF871 domain-containing protein n=1 Tax=Clostridium senegalense TaxID=1465809 RepID=A0A6M0H6D8_9CLOT|nr:MupG family TIM beta-alpha barrel fold protein [Clostridium senegalense]NEU05142.1 DUF871 domain-containing protein [Clostridium senegalense]